MSEFQYYEFQTIDRPLTEPEQAEISKLSRRVALTPTSAVFTYQFGDFPATPEKVLERYFDAMLYLANWGSRRLMFRLPKALIDLQQVRRYELEDGIEFRLSGKHVILDIHLNEESVVLWVEGEGRLSSLARLRDDILRHDYRLLYLAWLKGVSLESEDESSVEPPVPAGLQSLSSALRDFVDLFEIDSHLLAVAAKPSADLATLAPRELQQAIANLVRDECDDFLLRLVSGEPLLAITLHARLRELAGLSEPAPEARRTVAQLLAEAKLGLEKEKRKKAQAAERKRLAELEALARRENEAWREVENLIQKYNARGYEEAVQLVSKLGEVAVYKHAETAFQTRLEEIYARYGSRHSLLGRLRAARLPRM